MIIFFYLLLGISVYLLVDLKYRVKYRNKISKNMVKKLLNIYVDDYYEAYYFDEINKIAIKEIWEKEGFIKK